MITTASFRILFVVIVGAGLTLQSCSGPPPMSDPCVEYCTAIQTQCTERNAQYTSLNVCSATCATKPSGSSGDVTDSLACRVAALSKITTETGPVEKALGCLRAGPFSPTCGEGICDNFCALNMKICGTQQPPPYASRTECDRVCVNKFKDIQKTIGFIKETKGDSLECRAYHLEVATGDPKLHCPHTGAESIGTCQ
jgi:hypothetical protein